MKIVEPRIEILDLTDGTKILQNLEKFGRICYKSENNITAESAMTFIKNIVRSGHESVIEHEKVTVKIICDRGVSHEIVRHRIASYSQESTRYCNYSNNKFGGELTFIKPFYWETENEKYKIWLSAMQCAEKSYMALLEAGARPEEARCVLPNSLKTEIIVTMNLREWRHFFKLRTSERAHPQMRQIAVPLLNEFKARIPIIFDDI